MRSQRNFSLKNRNQYLLLGFVGHIVGEGNGTPLQYCCPENPMDGRAW